MIHTCDHSKVGKFAVVIYQDHPGCPVCENDENIEYDIPDDLSRALEDLIAKAEAVVESKGGDLFENEDIRDLASASQIAKEQLEWETK